MPRLGWKPVTVPGGVAMWVDLWRAHGRLPVRGSPARTSDRLRRERLSRRAPDRRPLDPRRQELLGPTPTGATPFSSTGRPPPPGNSFGFPVTPGPFGRSRRARARRSIEGDIAAAIETAARAENGFMRASDLAAHETLRVEPIGVDYRGTTLHEIPPERAGAGGLGRAWGVLRHFEIGDLDPDCPDVLHLQIEAVKLGFADAHRHVADPRFVDVSPAALLAPARLKELADRIDPTKAQSFDAGIPKPGGTILLCTADAEGRCVSAHPEQLHRLRFGRGDPGLGRGDAEPRGVLPSRRRSSQPGRPRQAAVPHHHSRHGDPHRSRPPRRPMGSWPSASWAASCSRRVTCRYSAGSGTSARTPRRRSMPRDSSG